MPDRMDGRLITSLLLLVYLGTTSVYSTYVNEFVANIQGGSAVADRLAVKYGFTNAGELESFPDHYVFHHREVHKRSTRPSQGSHTAIRHEESVNWIDQQVARKRVRRDVGWINDPQYYLQWYLNRKDAPNMNVEAAWELGYTGQGVVVTILDDGINYTHPDLAQNYDPLASLDLNSKDDDPMPRLDFAQSNRHGTRCAGEVAMVAGNGICGVGVAYNASIGGVRMLDGDVTDLVESQSFAARREHVDVYSSSWGPDDNGMTVDGPARLAKKAFKDGIEKGRRGKGSIFVWASGNGGRTRDNCGCDGYTNSIYTISISSTSERGRAPWYLEECSSTLATTYSSDSPRERKVVTTDLDGGCVDNHTGTSASAPLAAGLCALALQANANLTWRDMQYIIVMTSKRATLQDPEWDTNGAGYDISHLYGFGLMDAGALVVKARDWTNLPPQRTCVLRSHLSSSPSELSGVGMLASFQLNAADCHGSPRYLEHVQATLSLNFGSRGALVLTLVSPAGTRSRLLGHRPRDKRRGGFSDWPFMSTHFWGERPDGMWTLLVENALPRSNFGYFRSWSLTLYGTDDLPSPAAPPREPKGRGWAPAAAAAVKSQAAGQAAGDSSGAKVALPRYSDYLGPCHPECTNGCDGPNADQCVKCNHYRDRETNECVETCPDGFYGLPESHTRCRACPGECRTCQAASQPGCLSCYDSFFLMPTTTECVQICEEGYYADLDTNRCMQCPPLCSTCLNQDNCLICQRQAVLSTDSTCQLSCQRDEYQDGSSCRACHDDCAGCSGPASDQCLGCPEGWVLMDRSCVLTWTCQQGFYVKEESQECIRCHVSCFECNGPSSQDCEKCQEGYILQESECVSNCPDGYYKDEDGDCLMCSLGCDQCLNAEKCLTCEQEFSLLDGECQQGCGEGNYEHEGLCQPCHELCANCFGPGPEDCIDCIQGMDGSPRYLYQTFCMLHCPNGTYTDQESRRCRDCDETCLLCAGPTDDDCLSCFQGFRLVPEPAPEPAAAAGYCQEREGSHCNPDCLTCLDGSADRCETCPTGSVLQEDGCRDQCSEGFFLDGDECINCNPSCRTCRGPSGQECTGCPRGQYLYDDSTCDAHCPYTTYPDADSRTCADCHATCRSCSGPGPDSCQTCPVNRFWEDNQCLTDCPMGKFGDTDEHQCLACFPTCATCDGPFSTDCLTCETGLQLDHSSCHSPSECPLGTYEDDAGSCQDCHESCLSCTGFSRLDCTTCYYDRFLQEREAGPECLEECDSQFYPDYEARRCRPCHETCLSCVQGGPKDCMDCAAGLFILSKVDSLSCVQHCEEGYYELTQGRRGDESKTCQMCSPQCKDCTNSYSNCSSCLDNTFLFKSQCLPSCPEGFVEDYSSNACLAQDRQCPLNCQDCNEWGECERCSSGFEVYYGECMRPPCNDYQYQALDIYGNRQCRSCSVNCKRCLGPRTDECLACGANYRLNNGQCSRSCDSGQFDRDGVCLACHPSCESCVEASPFDCLSCREGTFHTLDEGTSSGQCSVACPEGTYLDGTSCLACDDNCLTCEGAGPTTCLSCKHDFYLTAEQSCNPSCPNDTYHYRAEDATEDFECRPCHSNCGTCYGPHKSNCRSCHDSMYLLKYTCVNHCGTGFYLGEDATCQECQSDCESCWGTADQCISCTDGKKLLDNACVDECPADHYLSTDFGLTCERCDERCQTCNDMGPFNCLSCPAAYRLEDNTCFRTCDLGTYFKSSTETGDPLCAPCHSSCTECVGPSDSDCIACPEGTSLHQLTSTQFQCLSCCSGKQQQDKDHCCDCDQETNSCQSAAPPRPVVKANLHTGAIVFVCLLLLAAFGLFFGLLQARSRKRLCWRSTYDQLPTVYDNKEKELKITLRQNILPSSDDDYFDDEDDEDDDVKIY